MGSIVSEEKKQKGKSDGGMMMGIKKELIKEEGEIETGTKGLMVGKVKREDERWKIVGKLK